MDDRAQVLLDILDRAGPGGLDADAVLGELRRHWPQLTPQQAQRLVTAAGDRVRVAGGRLRLVAGPHDPPGVAAEPAVGDTGEVGDDRRPWRAVALDVESAVRAVTEAPYTEARIFQVGAVRFGRDRAWVDAAAPLECWVALPDGFEVFDPQRAARHAAAAVAEADAVVALARFCDGADAVVAHNGSEVDFALLDQAAARSGVPPLGGARVDSLYLGLAVWPFATVERDGRRVRSHRLQDLAAHAGVPVGDLDWHDALDDARCAARLCEAAAAVVAGWDDDRASLVASVGVLSPAWGLVFDLAGRNPDRRVWRDAEVAAVVAELISGRDPVRGRPAPPPASVPPELRDASGRVDPHALAVAVRGSAQRRPQQDEMAAVMARWVAAGTDGMVEAPTGVGKTYAILATALDWLAAHPGGRVVVATHTKQLQAQLAEDLQSLAAASLGWLGGASGLVKGAANRLSLRALVSALADCCGTRRRGRRRPVDDARYGELVLFLLARFAAPAPSLVDYWESASVDAVDVPAFFDRYLEGRLGWYLATVSQGDTGDYDDDGGVDRLRSRTETAEEALGRMRLVVANHALLFAHLEAFEGATDTLLVVDEAHAVEDSATAALSAELDYQALESLVDAAGRFGSEAGVAAIVDHAGNLERILDAERLPTAASRAFDAIAGPRDRTDSPRSAVLVSDYSGYRGRRHANQVFAELRRLEQRVRWLRSSLGRWAGESLAGADRFTAERFYALSARAASVGGALSVLVEDLDVLAPPPPPPTPGPGGGAVPAAGPGAEPAGTGGGPDTGPDTGAGAEPDDDADAADDGGDPGGPDDDTVVDDAFDDAFDDASGDADDGSGGAGGPPGLVRVRSNRVIWAAEGRGHRFAAGYRGFRFTVTSSPIDLPCEAAWATLRDRFTRTLWVSATLTVADEWDHIRGRFGFGTDVAAARLDSPFDHAAQARLVCLADFPSWAEHGDQALRSVAQQVAGFVTEVARAVPAGDGDHTATAGGAMVVTTATAAAAGIADRLAAELSLRWPERHGDTPVPAVHAAPVVGNARAVRAFRSAGGALVGTRGLWAGVDIAESDRVRLLWINKLPFAPFADPLIATRRAAVAARAEAAGAPDPDAVANETYYLPLAALELRQGVGRLIRSPDHRGVVVISDRKLGGDGRLRRLYRRVFLASLDPGLCAGDGSGPDPWAANVAPMDQAWERIWGFIADGGELDRARASQLCEPEALAAHTVLPETGAIRALALRPEEVTELAADGRLVDEVLSRCETVAGLLRAAPGPVPLKEHQRSVIARVATGDDTVALLPTGYGKSFCYQLPGLVLPGVTVVISPLVALMTDQALSLNRSIGGAVRALVGPMRESVSRAGKTEVAEQLAGTADHGIRLVYVSPERAAQRAFADALRAGARTGHLTRIAIDEAHTLVSWGDDFRPAFRRLEGLLAELRAVAAGGGRRLSVTALTATANRTVRDALVDQVFDPSVPVVAANPIRPELAVWRRSLGRASGGLIGVAGLVEAVAETTPGHLIVYCTTIREVNATWAQLRDWAGPSGAWRVHRFHGRLAEAEKASVLNAFRDAPRVGDDGFEPMIVVATSAFGLGVDRDDVAAVLLASPPTDLAALHQAVGRAGRAQAGLGLGDPRRVGAVGMALATGRGWRTVEFLTTRDVPVGVLRRAGAAVLASGGLVDATAIGDRLIDTDVAARRLHPRDAGRRRTADAYRLAVVRALAALAGAGAVDDHGDLPEVVRVGVGDLDPPGPLEAALVDTVLGRDAADLRAVPIARLRTDLGAAGHPVAAGGPAAVWSALVEAHDAGWLDVSQAPTRRWLSAVTVRATGLPADFEDRVTARGARAATELAALRSWFADIRCAQRGLADYFGVEVPDDACGDAGCRCSTCWFDARVLAGDPTPAPALFDAFFARRPRPVSAAAEARQRDEVDALVGRLLWDTYAGLGPALIHAVLTGRDTVFNAATGRRGPLRRRLLYHQAFGRKPAVTRRAVEESLDRLGADGAAVEVEPGRWRWAAHVAADARRAARAGAAP